LHKEAVLLGEKGMTFAKVQNALSVPQFSKYAITMKLDRQKQERLANITQTMDKKTKM
jgi:hypothetical protein